MPSVGRRRVGAEGCAACSAILLVVCSYVMTGVVAYDLYKDATKPVEERVQYLLKRMTLAEKIGQMAQIDRSVADAPTVLNNLIGSVLNGVLNDTTNRSVPGDSSALAWQDMIDGFQNQAMATRLKIPVIYSTDAVHGQIYVQSSTIFPHNIGLGCTRDSDLLKRIGAAEALEIRATGIPYAFGPCIAVCRDPRWGRCYESYSEDPEIVRSMTDILFGLQGKPVIPGYPFVADKSKIATCAKHWVGDGGTTDGINENNTVASYKSLLSIHIAPYVDAIAKGVSTVMISYSSWNGVKMHANKFLITDVLKHQLEFQGFVISDWQGLDKLTDPFGSNYTYSILTGINAGIDMVIIPYDIPMFIGNLTQLVTSGYIKMARIDDAVTRILRVKFITGIFESPYADRSLTNQIGSPEHRQLAREAVRKSLVLLKNGKDNETSVLPLSKNARKILVAGTHANDIGLQCGGWTVSWQGSKGNSTNGTSILDGIKSAVSPSTEILYKEAPLPGFAKSASPDVAIVIVGEPTYAETYGDSLNLSLPAAGEIAIRTVCAEVKCVVVLVSGRPVSIAPLVPLVDALVAAWLPGTEGNGIADVIFGDFDFVGRSSRTWFKSVDQLPMNVGDKHYDPLFPFGFGLKYAS